MRKLGLFLLVTASLGTIALGKEKFSPDLAAVG